MQLFEYIQQGGPIMYILLAINVLGIAVMISKFIVFKQDHKRIDDIVLRLTDRLDDKEKQKDTGSLIELAKQEISVEINGMEKGLNTVKVIASISPLLGLLGTVIGVLIAFRVMSETGLNNPASFAQGISMALITTVGGMIVAIPHYIGHNYLIGMLDSLEVTLERKLISKIL